MIRDLSIVACTGNSLGLSQREFAMTPKTRIGLFGIGLDTYWPQFSGLKEQLERYLRHVEGKLQRPGIEVVNLA